MRVPVRRSHSGCLPAQEIKNSIFDMSRAAGGHANPIIDQQAVPEHHVTSTPLRSR
jgi:hypothetical protein